MSRNRVILPSGPRRRISRFWPGPASVHDFAEAVVEWRIRTVAFALAVTAAAGAGRPRSGAVAGIAAAARASMIVTRRNFADLLLTRACASVRNG